MLLDIASNVINIACASNIDCYSSTCSFHSKKNRIVIDTQKKANKEILMNLI